MFDTALPLQLSQLTQSRVHSGLNVLGEKEKERRGVKIVYIYICYYFIFDIFVTNNTSYFITVLKFHIYLNVLLFLHSKIYIYNFECYVF